MPDKTISLTLTTSEWCELYGAVTSKITRMRRGEYDDPSDEENEKVIKEWLQELGSVECKLDLALNAERVVH